MRQSLELFFPKGKKRWRRNGCRFALQLTRLAGCYLTSKRCDVTRPPDNVPSCYCCHNNSIRWFLTCSVVEHVLMPTRGWWSADSYVLPKIQLGPTTRWPFWLWLSRRIVALRRLVKTSWPPGNLQKSSSSSSFSCPLFNSLIIFWRLKWREYYTFLVAAGPDSRRLFHRWIVKSEEEKEKQDYLDGRNE